MFGRLPIAVDDVPVVGTTLGLSRCGDAPVVRVDNGLGVSVIAAGIASTYYVTLIVRWYTSDTIVPVVADRDR